MNELDTAAPTTTYAGRTAVERLYGSWDALNTALDQLDATTPDVWRDALDADDHAVSGIRALWTDDHEPIATAAEERALVELARSPEWSAAREAARERLTAASMPALKRLVRGFRFLPDWHEDAQQTALLGLWEAINGQWGFDPSKGHRRLATTIVRRVQDTLRDLYAGAYAFHVSTADRTAYAKAREAATEQIQADSDGRDPNEIAAELAPTFGLSTAAFWAIFAAEIPAEVQPSGEVTFSGEDSFLTDGGDGTFTVALHHRPLAEPSTSYVGREFAAALLNTLEGRAREVIALRFGLDGNATHTEDEAAAALSLTPRRIRQIQAAALDHLRATWGESIPRP